MKQIEAFVDDVYHGVGGNEKEIKELKAEMKNHLLEAVHELKLEGKTEQDAIDIAIERFGGEKEMRSIVGQLFKAQKTFANWVLCLAVTIFVLSSALVGYIWVNEERNASENSIVGTNIFNIVENKTTISEDMKEEIKTLVQGTDQISEVKVYNVSDLIKETGSASIRANGKEAKPTFQYGRSVWAPEWLLVDFFPYMYVDSEWYISMETRHMGSFMTLVLFVGVAIYAVLFTIWATINAYHHRRLKPGWIIAFALFNVIGYLVYRLVGGKGVKQH